MDVFLKDDFYGNIYRPAAILNDSIKPLTDFFWKNRENDLNFNKIKILPEYLNCIKKYKEWGFLIKECLQF